MTRDPSRRDFLAGAAALAAVPALSPAANTAEPLFKISLGQESLFRRCTTNATDALQFAKIAKSEFGIEAVEYCTRVYKTRKVDDGYVKELKKIADDNGVRSLIIRCDNNNEGNICDRDPRGKAALDNHRAWVDRAKLLGCHSITPNASALGRPQAQMEQMADALRKLLEYAAKMNIAVLVETRRAPASAEWMAQLMKKVEHKDCGTLPHFHNFNQQVDRYKVVDEAMPFAKGVAAWAQTFDQDGNETHTDYRKMLDIVVKKHKYRGFIGIQYEATKLSEEDGIKATKKLLETVRDELAKG